MNTPLKTYRDIANWQGVSIRTVEKWATYSDWPAKLPSGCYSRRSVRAFLRCHKLGEFNEVRHPVAGSLKAQSREYERRRIAYQAENLALANAKALRALEREVANILLREDAAEVLSKMAETVLATVDARIAEVRSLYDEIAPAASDRQNVEAILDRFRRDVKAVLEQAANL